MAMRSPPKIDDEWVYWIFQILTNPQKRVILFVSLLGTGLFYHIGVGFGKDHAYDTYMPVMIPKAAPFLSSG